MEKIKNTMQAEWDVIISAPWSVAAIVCVTAGIVWWLRGLLAKNRADALNQHLKLLKEKLDGVDDTNKLEDMQRQIEEIRPKPMSFVQGTIGD